MTVENKELMNGWGQVDNEESNGGASQIDRPDFLKVEIGDTKIRVLDLAPHKYNEWWSTRGNGGDGCSIPYFGKGKDLLEKANQAHMSKVFKEADSKNLKDKARKDFLRDEGYKKQPWGKMKEKYIIHVLDRATGEVKLLDKGNGIFKKIKALAMNEEYGDPREYDVTIVMSGDPKDFTTIEYDVTPARSNTPLTDAERALYEEKKIDIALLKGTGDMTPEQALTIAKGATFKDVLGSGETAEESEENTDPKDLPQEETRKDEEVNIDKEEALSDEELAGISFD